MTPTNPDLSPGSRGMSTPLSHVLSLGITTLLVIALVASATGFLDTHRERSATDELRTIGNRLAGELAKVDTLARNGDSVSVTTRHPETIAGSTYAVQIHHDQLPTDDDCGGLPSDTCLELSASQHAVSAIIPVHNETNLELTSGANGRFVISSPGGSGTAQADSRQFRLSPRVGVGSSVGSGPSVGTGANLRREPEADFMVVTEFPRIDSDTEFDGTASSDPDGSITSWEWDFDDDGSFERSGPNPTWNYSEAGTKLVTLRVTDDRGNTDTEAKPVPIGGLVYNNDLQVMPSNSDGIRFSVTNKHASPVVIHSVFIDPEDPIQDEVSEGRGGDEHELEVNLSSTSSEVDGWGDGDIEIPDPGTTAELGSDQFFDRSGPVELGPGETARIKLQDFPVPPAGTRFNLGVGHRVGSDFLSIRFNGTAVTP